MARSRGFRQADLTRAVRAVRAAGAEIDRIEIDANSGRLIVIVKNGSSIAAPDDDDVAGWLKKHARKV